MVDRTTPFRETGDCTLTTFIAELKGSPIENPEACWQAVKGMSALALSQAIKESSLGTTEVARRTKNPLMLFDYTGTKPVYWHTYGGYQLPVMVFERWSDAFAEWMRRMSDPTYKNGVYPAGCTLEQYIVTYVAGPDCWQSKGKTCSNGESWNPNGSGSVNLYLTQTIERINRLKEVRVPTFGKVPRPKIVNRIIPDYQNIAWDDLGPRRMKGIVYHRQVGTNWGTDGWFRMLWQPNGKPGGGQIGLTDFGVDHNTGEILQWNDHEGKPSAGVSANRAGWASGPWQGPSGPGGAFVTKYGVDAINRDLVSIEVAGYYDTPIAPTGMESIIALSAWLADQALIPWSSYPTNPATGLTFVYTHNNFQNNKPCAGTVVLNVVPNLVAAVRERLRQYQEDETVEEDLSSWFFGSATGNDNVSYVYAPNGSVSKLWKSQCEASGKWPKLEQVKVTDRRKLFVFSDGSLIEWTASGGAKAVKA